MHNVCHVLIFFVAIATLVYMQRRNERVAVVIAGQPNEMLFAPRHRYGIIGFGGLLASFFLLLIWSLVAGDSLVHFRTQTHGVFQLIAGTVSTFLVPLVQKPSPERSHAASVFLAGSAYGVILFFACS